MDKPVKEFVFGDCKKKLHFDLIYYFPEKPYDTSHYRLKLLETHLNEDGKLGGCVIDWKEDLLTDVTGWQDNTNWRTKLRKDELPGHIELTLSDQWQPLPSLTPADQLRAIRCIPETDFQLARCQTTGRLLIKYLVSRHKWPILVKVEVDFIIAPEQTYFTQLTQENPLVIQSNLCSQTLRSLLDENIFNGRTDICEAYQELSIINNINNIPKRLNALMDWLDKFSYDKNISGKGKKMLLNLLKNKQGACEQKSIIFENICRYWGLTARQVRNVGHAFVEVSPDGGGTWRQYQLGGGGQYTQSSVDKNWNEYHPTDISGLWPPITRGSLINREHGDRTYLNRIRSLAGGVFNGMKVITTGLFGLMLIPCIPCIYTCINKRNSETHNDEESSDPLIGQADKKLIKEDMVYESEDEDSEEELINSNDSIDSGMNFESEDSDGESIDSNNSIHNDIVFENKNGNGGFKPSDSNDSIDDEMVPKNENNNGNFKSSNGNDLIDDEMVPKNEHENGDFKPLNGNNLIDEEMVSENKNKNDYFKALNGNSLIDEEVVPEIKNENSNLKPSSIDDFINEEIVPENENMNGDFKPSDIDDFIHEVVVHENKNEVGYDEKELLDLLIGQADKKSIKKDMVFDRKDDVIVESLDENNFIDEDMVSESRSEVDYDDLKELVDTFIGHTNKKAIKDFANIYSKDEDVPENKNESKDGCIQQSYSENPTDAAYSKTLKTSSEESVSDKDGRAIRRNFYKNLEIADLKLIEYITNAFIEKRPLSDIMLSDINVRLEERLSKDVWTSDSFIRDLNNNIKRAFIKEEDFSAQHNDYIDYLCSLCEINNSFKRNYLGYLQIEIRSNPYFKDRVQQMISAQPPFMDKIIFIAPDSMACFPKVNTFVHSLTKSKYLENKLSQVKLNKSYTMFPKANSHIALERLVAGLPAFVNQSILKDIKPLIIDIYNIHPDIYQRIYDNLSDQRDKKIELWRQVLGLKYYVNIKGNEVLILNAFFHWLAIHKPKDSSVWIWLLREYKYYSEQKSPFEAPFINIRDGEYYAVEQTLETIRTQMNNTNAVVFKQDDFLFMIDEFLKAVSDLIK